MVVVLAFNLFAVQAELDSDLPDYRAVPSLQGALSPGPDGGFDSLLALWIQRLKTHSPDLRAPEASAPSPLSTPQAMSDGTARWGLLPRRWTIREVDTLKESYGKAPLELLVGADAVVVIVHRDNPLQGATIDQLDAVYSSAPRRGGPRIRSWGELGLGENWKTRPVHPLAVKRAPGRPSRARDVFGDRVLKGAPLGPDVRELADAAAVLTAVTEDPAAIGFLSYGSKSDEVRGVPVRPSGDQEGIEPTREAVLGGTYPLARPICLSCRIAPGTSGDAPLHELFLLILSREGQMIVKEQGYVPISGPLARKQTKLVK